MKMKSTYLFILFFISSINLDASQSNQPNVLFGEGDKLLLSSNGGDNKPRRERCRTDLHAAAYACDYAQVKSLLKLENSDVNEKNHLGRTPIFSAMLGKNKGNCSLFSKLKIGELLISAGASIDVVDNKGKHFADFLPAKSVVHIFLDQLVGEKIDKEFSELLCLPYDAISDLDCESVLGFKRKLIDNSYQETFSFDSHINKFEFNATQFKYRGLYKLRS